MPCGLSTIQKAGYKVDGYYEDAKVDADEYTVVILNAKDDSEESIEVYVRNDNTYEIAATDGIVCGINVCPGTDFSTSDDFTPDSKLKNFTDKFGEPSLKSEEDGYGTYIWNEKGSEVNGLTVTVIDGKIAMIELVTGL